MNGHLANHTIRVRFGFSRMVHLEGNIRIDEQVFLPILENTSGFGASNKLFFEKEFSCNLQTGSRQQ